MVQWEGDVTSLIYTPQIHNFTPIMRKHQTKDQGHERQGKAEILSHTERDLGDMTTKHNVVSCSGSGTAKGH